MEKYRLFNNEKICLFCGEIIEPSYEDYETYYQCDCVDAKKVEEIEGELPIS